MPAQQIEPLEAALWFRELERLSVSRANLDGQAPDTLIRRAFYLLQLTPSPLREFLPCSVDEPTLEAYLECGAYLSAVMSLISTQTGITVCRAPASGKVKASILLAHTPCEGVLLDDDPVKALLGAWLRAVLSLRPSARNINGPSEQVGRGERDRKSTRH